MLILPIERKWLNMILSGEKKDEYREIKPYWTVRIIHWLGFPSEETETVLEPVLELLRVQGTIKALPVILQNGYRRDSPEVEVMCKLSIGTGREEWGAVPGKEYYRFHIEQIGRMAGIKEGEVEDGTEQGVRLGCK